MVVGRQRTSGVCVRAPPISINICATIVLMYRPGHDWPILIAANRDEMNTRSWRAPGRHWHDRKDVTAGLDELGGGTWLGINDAGVVAGVLNRLNSLGPMSGCRSRGELPLEALDHAEARTAAEALGQLDPLAYRPFNLVIADRTEAFWLRSAATSGDEGVTALKGQDHPRVDVLSLPPGLSMITAYDLNDMNSPRIRNFRPKLLAAPLPDPSSGDWSGWIDILAETKGEEGAGPGGAMTIKTATGFGTVSSSLIALPAQSEGPKRYPIWLFADGRPGEVPFQPVAS
ncbi:MAG: hypothetical protein HC834_01625 [Rhodospirillales bacterium]|nr:hypothetical protein [Rhodospirillales bacterium]